MIKHELKLRLPHDLKIWLQGYAAAHERSMNAQILTIIRAARAAQVSQGSGGRDEKIE